MMSVLGLDIPLENPLDALQRISKFQISCHTFAVFPKRGSNAGMLTFCGCVRNAQEQGSYPTSVVISVRFVCDFLGLLAFRRSVTVAARSKA